MKGFKLVDDGSNLGKVKGCLGMILIGVLCFGMVLALSVDLDALLDFIK